jgi:hypothetical protein
MLGGMDAVGVAERAGRIIAVRDDVAASDDLIESGLVAVREVQAWAEAQHAALVAKLSSDGFPEARVANAARTSIGAAVKSTQRSRTLTSTPKLAETLGDGQTTAGHVDAVTRVAAQLPQAQRSVLFDRVDALADVAAVSTVEQFARRVALEAKRIQADDGLDRLERQRRAVRTSSWVDADGMWNVRGRFDPVTGVRLASKLSTTVEALFAEAVPDGCPEDPVEKQKFLTGHALAALIDGTAGVARSGRSEYVVVVDADADLTTHGPGPVAEWPIPVEIPARVLAELAGDADVHAVVVRNGVVLHAPGELNLGRTTRLANRAQRRALRGLYRGCAIPGCTVAYDRCNLHHLIWWRRGGATDLDNLLPLCSKHHGKIHNDGWVIELGAHRELTLRLPDGSIHNTGPPIRRTAA